MLFGKKCECFSLRPPGSRNSNFDRRISYVRVAPDLSQQSLPPLPAHPKSLGHKPSGAACHR